MKPQIPPKESQTPFQGPPIHRKGLELARNTISKLNLVDLAGSERNDSEERSQAKAGRLEAARSM